MCWGGWVGVEIKDKISYWPFLTDIIYKNSIEILVNMSTGLCLDTVYKRADLLK